MNNENLHRELRKIKQAVDLAVTYHIKDNEKNAALHATDDVLYSPLTTRLNNAQASLGRLIQWLEEESNAEPPPKPDPYERDYHSVVRE